MGAKEHVFHFFFFLIVTEVTAISSWIPNNYEIAEKYSCMKKVDIFFDRAVLFKYADVFLNSWAGSGDFDCEMSVFSRTESAGVLIVIQKMNFRKTQECLDYMTFGDGRGKYCGKIFFGMNPILGDKLPRPPKFISEYAGPFDKSFPTYSAVAEVVDEVYEYDRGNFGFYNQRQEPRTMQTERRNERTDLLPPGAMVQPDNKFVVKTHVDSLPVPEPETMDLLVAFTGYKDCNGPNIPEGWFNCGYGLCILMQYVKDGIVNCPFGDCRDEGSCEEAMESSPLMKAFWNETEQVDSREDLLSNGTVAPVETSSGLKPSNIDATKGKQLRKGLNSLEEVKNIGEEFKKHNEILERLSYFIENAVHLFQDGKFVKTELDLIQKQNPSTSHSPERK